MKIKINYRDFFRLTLFLWSGLFFFLIFPFTSLAIIVFENDTFLPISSDGIILDVNDNASSSINLQFGTTIAESLAWNISAGQFDLSDDLSLTGNQILSFRIETVTSLPGGAGGLTAGDAGRTVTLTTTDAVAPGCVALPHCFAGTYSWNGTIWKSLTGDHYARTIQVATSGANFTSIKAAVDSITDASSTNRYTVEVYPGIYNEDPIVIPDYVSVQGVGDFYNTQVIANSTTGTLITSGLESAVKNLTLQGASGVGGKCYRSTKKSGTLNLRFISCETGISISGATAQWRGSNIIVDSGTFTDVVKIDSGAAAGFTQLSVTGATVTATNAIHITGTGTTAALGTIAVKAPFVTNGIYINDNAKVEVGNVTVQFVQNGVRVGPTGVPVLNGTGGVITNNSVYNFYVESASARVYYTGVVTNKSKFNIPQNFVGVITFNDDTTDDEALNVVGELNVGMPEQAQESLFGEGDSYTDGMLVYTFNGTTYTDVSAAAKNPTASPFTLPGVGVNNAIYISSNRKDTLANFVKFGGYRMLSSSTALSGGSLVHEYWNGSAWTSLPVMCFHATLLYRYDGSCFLRANSDEYVLFDDTMKATWALNDPPTTGTNRYWVRIRVATTLTTAPVFEQFKVSPNSVQINPDGTFTFLGNSRHKKTFISSPESIFFGQGTNIPGNSSFTVGSGGTAWTMERAFSAFIGTGSAIEEITGSIALPRGIDTSSGLNVRIYWKKTSSATGNVQWKLAYVVAGAKNVPVTNGSSIPTAPRATSDSLTALEVKTIETSPTGTGLTANDEVLSDFTTEMKIDGKYEGDTLFMRLYRDPADADDTYAADAVMVGFEVSGVFWTLGEKL